MTSSCTFFSVIHRWNLSFWDAIRITKLCCKYGADTLLDWAIKPIQRRYGLSLKEYLRSPTYAHQHAKTDIQPSSSRSSTPGPVASSSAAVLVDDVALTARYHIAAINFARHCYFPEFLPLAFYLAATSMSLKEISQGVTVKPADGGKPEVFTFDDPEDMLRCAEGKLRLATNFHPCAFFSAMLRAMPANGYGRYGCTECHAAPFVQWMRGKEDGTAINWMQLPTLISADAFVASIDVMCDGCRRRIKTEGVVESYRDWLWRNLSCIFDLTVKEESKGEKTEVEGNEVLGSETTAS